MAFDADLVTDRICELAYQYIGKYLPPPVLPTIEKIEKSSLAGSASTLDYAGKMTRKGLILARKALKYIVDQANETYFQNEGRKIDEILSSLSLLNHPDACENWISFIIQLGEDAHLSKERTLFRELLHAIRCVILENIQADEELSIYLKAKSEFLETQLRNELSMLDEHYASNRIEPEIIEPLEAATHQYMRKLAWIGHRLLIRGTGLINQVFPNKTYRYFYGEDADKRGLPRSIYPIVLTSGEKSFYCYYAARKLGMPPNHNHKITFHRLEENWEAIIVSENGHPPIYGDNISISDGFGFFQAEPAEQKIAVDVSDDEQNDQENDIPDLEKNLAYQ